MQDGQRVLEEAEQVTEVTQPIIIDLGKQRPKRIKQLKRGEGKLWHEVLDVVDEVKTQLHDEVQGKTLVPIIMVYSKKRKKRRRINPLFPLS